MIKNGVTCVSKGFGFLYEGTDYQFTIPLLRGELPISGPVKNDVGGKTHYIHRDSGLHGLFVETVNNRHYYLDFKDAKVYDRTNNGLPNKELGLAYDPHYLKPCGEMETFSFESSTNTDIYPAGENATFLHGLGTERLSTEFKTQRYSASKSGSIVEFLHDIPKDNFFPQFDATLALVQSFSYVQKAIKQGNRVFIPFYAENEPCVGLFGSIADEIVVVSYKMCVLEKYVKYSKIKTDEDAIFFLNGYAQITIENTK